MRLVQKRARVAQRVLRFRKAHLRQLVFHAHTVLLLLSATSFKLFLVLQHHPARILHARICRFGLLVRLEQQRQGSRRQNDRHQHQAEAQRRERQTGDFAAVHEQRNARGHERHRQRDGQRYLHVLLPTCRLGNCLLVIGLKQRLIRRLRGGEIVACQVNGVFELGVFGRQHLDAVAQVPLFGGRDARKLHRVLFLGRTVLATQVVFLLAQIRDLRLQVARFGFQLFKRLAVRRQHLDRCVQLADLRQQVLALRGKLGELFAFALELLDALRLLRNLLANSILLALDVH